MLGLPSTLQKLNLCLLPHSGIQEIFNSVEGFSVSDNISTEDQNAREPFFIKGYYSEPTKRIIIKIRFEEAEFIRKIFELYAQGNGQRAIARILNEQEVPPPSRKSAISKHLFVGAMCCSECNGILSSLKAVLQN